MTDEKSVPKVDSTLSKGLSILENLAAAGEGKGVTELALELGLTKSNTFRLLQTLKALGYVRHLDDKTYAATLKTWQTGRQTVEKLNLRQIAAEQMQQLSANTGETVYLAVAENLSVIYIDKIDSLKPIRSWNPVGGSAPLHCVGTGKALLCANYQVLRERVRHHLSRHTDKTLTSITALDKDMTLTRERGYAFDAGEFRERILSLGAAIHLPDGEAVAALGISLPDINMGKGGDRELGEFVARAAESVTQKLSRL